MTYNEWRDELKTNLLCVSEAERRRVLDYYAEAYADRREAGFSEREIIDEFGAPYDAARRILNDSADDEPKGKPQPAQNIGEAPQPVQTTNDAMLPAPPPAHMKNSYGWLFVILCIIFSVPLFLLITVMVCATIVLISVPFALVIAGAAGIGGSIGIMISGNITYGILTLGEGFVALGAGIILFPMLGKLIKLMWKAFKAVFVAVKKAFTGKEQTV